MIFLIIELIFLIMILFNDRLFSIFRMIYDIEYISFIFFYIEI